jgi:hypothetical protein
MDMSAMTLVMVRILSPLFPVRRDRRAELIDACA